MTVEVFSEYLRLRMLHDAAKADERQAQAALDQAEDMVIEELQLAAIDSVKLQHHLFSVYDRISVACIDGDCPRSAGTAVALGVTEILTINHARAASLVREGRDLSDIVTVKKLPCLSVKKIA